MEGEKTNTPPGINLAHLGGKFAFHTSNEFITWLAEEGAFWGWLQTTPPPANELANNLRVKLKEIGRGLADQSKSDLTGAVTEAEKRFKANNWPHSTSPQARYVEHLRLNYPAEAVGALAYFARLSPASIPNHVSIINGFSKAIQFEAGSESGITARVSAIDALHERLQAELTSITQARESIKNAFLLELENIKNAAQEVEKRCLDGAVTVVNEYENKFKKFDALYKDRDNQFSVLEATYESKLRLEAPVTYWTAKRIEHENEKIFYQKITGAYFILGFLALLGANHFLMSESTFQTVKVTNLFVFSLLATIFIWIGRLIVRTLLSHMHLETDAHERAVMAETFLALRKSNQVSDEAEKITLSALMRHSSDGIVRDDASPWFTNIPKFGQKADS